MAQTAAPTKTRSTTRRAPTAQQSRAKAKRSAARTDALPEWSALGGRPMKGSVAKQVGRAAAGAKQASKRAASKAGRARPLDAVPSLRFGVMTVLACIVLTLFVSHVYATRATLDALQSARRQNEALRLTHQRLQGAFDRMTAPDVVMPRATALGLQEGVAYGPPITLTTD